MATAVASRQPQDREEVTPLLSVSHNGLQATEVNTAKAGVCLEESLHGLVSFITETSNDFSKYAQ